MPSHDRTRWVPAPDSGLRDVVEPDPDQPVHERLGRYRLIEEIGEGGMGVVHLAVDPRGRAVAIKVLRAHVAHDTDARTRLGREVETLSLVRDARVASVIDADVMGPRPYIVTRYVAGPPLDEVVEQGGPLEPEALLQLARGTAEAIRVIHSCGVVHRDIKPGNVLIEEGEPVLIDFGIAHLQDDVRHTIGGLVMGTPGYLSPELVEGAAITDATDWWGWAATITFAASGRPPFGRGRMDAVLSRVRAGEVDLVGVDPRLAPLLRASLSPNPAERPHADEVLDALERFALGEDATVPTPGGGPWAGRAPVNAPPVSSTQVLEARSTSVLPEPVPARVASPRGVPARVAPAPAPWAPPTGPRVPPGVSPAAYGTDVDAWDGGDEGDWDDEWDEDDELEPQREGDPRIGLPMRTGTLAGAALAWLGALAVWPGVALVLFLLWSTLARALDRSITGLVLRRHASGRRRSDVPMAVALSPWHLVLGVIATLVGLVLPVLVALAGIFAVALMLGGTGTGDLGPGSPPTLVVGGALGLLMCWWGPGGASLRRGSRSIVRRIVPDGTASQVVTGALIGLGIVLAGVALSRGTSISWAPFGTNPFGG